MYNVTKDIPEKRYNSFQLFSTLIIIRNVSRAILGMHNIKFRLIVFFFADRYFYVMNNAYNNYNNCLGSHFKLSGFKHYVLTSKK